MAVGVSALMLTSLLPMPLSVIFRFLEFISWSCAGDVALSVHRWSMISPSGLRVGKIASGHPVGHRGPRTLGCSPGTQI